MPDRGSKANASHLEEICGGNALNAAIAIARLDGRASLVGHCDSPQPLQR